MKQNIAALLKRAFFIDTVKKSPAVTGMSLIVSMMYDLF